MLSHAQADRVRAKKIFGATEAEVRKQLLQVNWGDKAVWVHRLMAPYLMRAFALTFLEPKAKEYVVKRIECFCWRDVRGDPGLLSMHSFAIAPDINPDENPMTYRGGPLVTDMPREFVSCFMQAGFQWGGFYSRPDAMHLELREEFWGVPLLAYGIGEKPNAAGGPT